MAQDIWVFILVGFAAQLVDGALGMAFGVISSTLLISLGVPPVVASAGVHTVETFTTGASGLSHIYHRNIDWKLFRRLAVPGVAGGVLGAFVLTQIDASIAKPLILTYLAMIGLTLVVRAWKATPKIREPRFVAPLGLLGGFLDASGGGGWGPIVTSNLLLQGSSPRQTIGTVNSAEFLLTLAVSATFLLSLGPEILSKALIGLLIGGVAAAPFGALLAKRIPARALMLVVGFVLTATSGFGILRALA